MASDDLPIDPRLTENQPLEPELQDFSDSPEPDRFSPEEEAVSKLVVRFMCTIT